MNSFSIPKPLFQPVRARRFPSAPQEAMLFEGRSMIKALGWTSTILVAGFLVWQLTVTDPIWPRILSAALLVTISCLAGIRIGTLGATSYIADVQRMNKILAEQHQELEELNAMMLKQMNAEVESPAASE